MDGMKGLMTSPEDRHPCGIARRDILRLAAAACLAIIAPGWVSCSSEPVSKVGDAPPSRILEDLEGNPFDVPVDFRGRVVLIHFWAAWCPFCRPEMKTLEAFYQKYGKQTLIPCSINLGESREAALSYIRNLNLTYPILRDPKSTLVRPYGVSGVPTTFVLDRGGIIRFRIVGEIDRDALEGLVRTLLETGRS
ncbi:MAG: hypothetical protein CVU61_15860 [Deltaproteobacteria bacterium HGW-Deltaproteobacteria-19]|jgi:thiol-disulfide isomerase/thioredoxin|nr:MAG: hypothetical protein CVU61_15860 [Deltaproteobacteria bacterium HGW-Deltaproteobacteria-19]